MSAGHYIQGQQQKNNAVEVLPIPEQALQLICEKRVAADQVLAGLEYSATNNGILRDWVKAAGITK